VFFFYSRRHRKAPMAFIKTVHKNTGKEMPREKSP